MSKKSELLQLLGSYYDGLSARDLQIKLPSNWFNTTKPAKEVSNALRQLAISGVVEHVEMLPDLPGVWRWKVKSTTQSKEDEMPAEKAIQHSDQRSEVVADPCPEGVRRVVRYIAETDESEWSTAEGAARRNQEVLLREAVDDFYARAAGAKDWADPVCLSDAREVIVRWEAYRRAA